MSKGWILALLLIPWTHLAHAEPSLNKRLINECPEVLSSLDKLSEQQRSETVNELIAVISYDSGAAIEAPQAPIMVPPSTLSNIRTGEAWSAIQIGQILQAKHCALDALKLLSPNSIQAGPELIKLRWHRSSPPDIRKLAAGAWQSIAADVNANVEFKVPDDIIAQIMALMNGELRVAAENAAIGISTKIIPVLLRDLSSANKSRRAEVLELLGLIEPDGTLSFPAVLELLNSSDAQAREQALAALINYPTNFEQSFPEIVRMLNDSAISVQEGAVRMLNKIICAAPQLQLGPIKGVEPRRWMNFIPKFEGCPYSQLAMGLRRVLADGKLEGQIGLWLSTGGAAQRELAVKLAGAAELKDPASAKLVIHALKDAEPSVRVAALETVINLKLVNKEAVAAMVNLLGDSDASVRASAQKALIAAGAPALEPIRLARTSPQLTKQIGAYLVLARLDPKTNVSPIEHQLARADCSQRLDIALAIETLKNEPFSGLIWACRDFSDDDPVRWWRALSASGPLSDPIKTQIVELVKQSNTPADTILHFLDNSWQIAVDSQQIFEVYRRILSSPNDALRHEAIVRLAKLGSKAQPLSPDLLSLIKHLKDDNLLRHDIAVALANIGANDFDLVDFFVHEFNSERYSWAQSSISQLHPELAKSILTRALPDIDRKHLAAALHTVGSLGEQGADMEQLVSRWLGDEDPQTSYEAACALLKINPNSPRAPQILLSELSGLYSERLSHDNLSESTVGQLRAIASQADHIVEMRRAQSILRSIQFN